MMRGAFAAALFAAAFAACAADGGRGVAESRLFADPVPVTIEGYDGHAMEPFLTRDGRYLLFNDLNAPWVDTDLRIAERVDATHFRYLGELSGANSTALDGVATMDREGRFYFVSMRDYERTRISVFSGRFVDGEVADVRPVAGLSRGRERYINFDVDVAPDGKRLYFVDGRFGLFWPKAADIVQADRDGGGFSPSPESAAILRNVNTDALEYAPCISADGLTLLFTRASPGIALRASIYVAQRARLTDPFGVAARLIALEGHVEAPTFAVGERGIYFHREVDGRFAIFLATRSPAVKAP
jgi:Tol biopolymer transport system component